MSQKLSGPVEQRELLADGLGRDLAFDEADLAGGVDPVAAGLGREQPAQHLIGGPRHGRDRRDAEPLVDQGPPGVVDPRDDVLDAVGLAGDPGAQDVGVVAARHRREGLGLGDAGGLEVVAVEPEADDFGPGEVGGQAAERPCVLVDDGHACGWSDSRAPANSLPTRPQPMTTTCNLGLPLVQ